MPWKSAKQSRWGNSPAGVKAMGSAKVKEFNDSTPHGSLKEHMMSMKRKGKLKMKKRS